MNTAFMTLRVTNVGVAQAYIKRGLSKRTTNPALKPVRALLTHAHLMIFVG